MGTEVVNKIIASSDPGNITMTSDTNRFVGDKRYELSNHLGNVLEVITDRKLAIQDGIGGLDYYSPDVVSYSDYYPFGWALPGRNGSADDYRYSFNGKEKIDEVAGSGNTIDFGARIYDARVGRWLSGDPNDHLYPNISPYAYSNDNPVVFSDRNGKDPITVLVAAGCFLVNLYGQHWGYFFVKEYFGIPEPRLMNPTVDAVLDWVGVGMSVCIGTVAGAVAAGVIGGVPLALGPAIAIVGGASIVSYLAITGIKWIIHGIFLVRKQHHEKMVEKNHVEKIPLPKIEPLYNEGSTSLPELKFQSSSKFITMEDLEEGTKNNLIEDRVYYKNLKNGYLQEIRDIRKEWASGAEMNRRMIEYIKTELVELDGEYHSGQITKEKYERLHDYYTVWLNSYERTEDGYQERIHALMDKVNKANVMIDKIDSALQDH